MSDVESEWMTDSGDVPQPAVKARKRKRGPGQKASKKRKRQEKREREQEEVDPTDLRRPRFREEPATAFTELKSEAHFPVNSTGYTAQRVESIKVDELWTLDDLKKGGIDVMAWDGWCVAKSSILKYCTYGSCSKSIAILDQDGRIVAVLVGRPIVKPGNIDDWHEVVAGLEAAIHKLKLKSNFTKGDKKHRRGPHYAKAFGVSHGGGQKVTMHKYILFHLLTHKISPAT